MNYKKYLLKIVSASHSTENQSQAEPNRREFLAGLTGIVALTALEGPKGMAQDASHALNIARVAVPSSLTALSENKISALNDGFTPEKSFGSLSWNLRTAAGRVECEHLELGAV